jgi:hypothetical protein
MKGMAAAILLLSMTTATTATTATAAIRCQDAAGHEPGAHWSWREIDGKRCWFMREGGTMPPKSAFTWAKAAPAKENINADIAAAPEKRKAGPIIELLKVRADEMSEVRANWLDDAPVDLIVGQDLSGAFGIGGSWVVPAYAAQAGETTSFTARFVPAR